MGSNQPFSQTRHQQPSSRRHLHGLSHLCQATFKRRHSFHLCFLKIKGIGGEFAERSWHLARSHLEWFLAKNSHLVFQRQSCNPLKMTALSFLKMLGWLFELVALLFIMKSPFSVSAPHVCRVALTEDVAVGILISFTRICHSGLQHKHGYGIDTLRGQGQFVYQATWNDHEKRNPGN